MSKNTKVTVTVSYEVEYDGKVSEDDIDINDIIILAVRRLILRDEDAIKDIKIKTKSVRG
jgi:hypothetical protein